MQGSCCLQLLFSHWWTNTTSFSSNACTTISKILLFTFPVCTLAGNAPAADLSTPGKTWCLQTHLLLTCSSDSPQLSVQRLDHGCKTPARLVQIHVAGPQTLRHGLLAGETKEGCLSVEARGSAGAAGSGGLLQAPLSEPPALRQEGGPRSGAAAPRRRRERAPKHGQRARTLAASSGHAQSGVDTVHVSGGLVSKSPCRGQASREGSTVEKTLLADCPLICKHARVYTERAERVHIVCRSVVMIWFTFPTSSALNRLPVFPNHW